MQYSLTSTVANEEGKSEILSSIQDTCGEEFVKKYVKIKYLNYVGDEAEEVFKVMNSYKNSTPEEREKLLLKQFNSNDIMKYRFADFSAFNKRKKGKGLNSPRFSQFVKENAVENKDYSIFKTSSKAKPNFGYLEDFAKTVVKNFMGLSCKEFDKFIKQASKSS